MDYITYMHGKAVFDEVIYPIGSIIIGGYIIYFSIKQPEKLGKYQKKANLFKYAGILIIFLSVAEILLHFFWK